MVSFSKYNKYKSQAHKYGSELRKVKKSQNQYLNPIKNTALDQATEMARLERNKARESGRSYANEVLSRNYQGLTPVQRQNMEERGQQGINREMQGYQRQLASNQGRQGIRGGAAYAQQADLARIGAQSQQELQRDISNLDQDLALKKLAAAFNIEQGEASQSQLDRQLALEQAELEQEKKNQKKLQEQYSKLFRRV